VDTQHWNSDTQAAAYLAGMFDGEGCVAVARHKGERRDYVRTLQISNADEALIDACTSALDRLGMTWATYTSKPRKAHHLAVQRIHIQGRENLIRFMAVVPFRSAIKREKLVHALSTYQNHYRRIADIRDDLESMWVHEGLSAQEVATHFECSTGSVYRWLREAGIPGHRTTKRSVIQTHGARKPVPARQR
jgi:UDP-N-acetylmuramoylalanine-D-glutamate ligase